VNSFGSKCVDVAVVERCHCYRSDNPFEQSIGEAGITCERWSVQVGANDRSGHYTFRAISVALAHFDRREGHGVRPWNGPTSMVFKPCEWAEFDEAVGSCDAGISGEQFSDGARAVDSDSFAVKQTKPAAAGAGCVGKSMTKDLHACANGEDDCPLVDSPMKPLAALEFAGGLHLRAVFAAAYEIEVGGIGNGCSGIHCDVLYRNPSPFETTGKNEGVAPVAVGAEKVWIERNDSNRRVSSVDARSTCHSTPPTLSR
jgi:hypothetical protein